jgi:DNA-binding transcriptional MerR regulator
MAGTETSMVYRIGANLDELKKNLSEGKAIITQVNADVAKIGGTSTTATRVLRDGLNGTVPASDNLYKSFKQVDNILESLGINARSEIKTLEQLRETATTGASGMDAFAKAGLVAAAAIGGWKLGEKISEWTGWGEAISDVTAKLMGFGDVAAQRAAAGADTLAKASKLVGFQVTDMGTALKILTGDVEDHAKALDTSANRTAGWRQEIAKVRSDGNWSKLTEDIASQNFSLAELSKRYGITVDAIQFFTREQQKADDAVAASNQRMLENLKNTLEAQKQQRERAEQVSEAMAHVSLAQGKYADVLGQFDTALVENVKHWTDLGASVDDIATILDQPAGKIEIVSQAIQQQNAVLDDWGNHWKQAAADVAAAMDQLVTKTQEDAQKQADAFKQAQKRISDDQHRMTDPVLRTYDLSTSEGMAEFRQLNPGAVFYGDATKPEYFRRHTLQDAIAAGLIDLYGAYHGGTSTHGFANGTNYAPGGMALVGEKGPEIVNLPRGSQVIPNHQIAGVGGVHIEKIDVHVAGNVVGTQHELARLVGDALMAKMRAEGMRFPVTRT